MADKAKKAEETKEITLETTNGRIDELVNVVNNLIMYCNTVEKWRQMSFKPADKSEKSESKEKSEVISDADDKK